MWNAFAELILRFRLGALATVLLLTGYLTYYGMKNAEVSQDYLNVIPPDDPDLINYQSFTNTFGAEGNTLIIALRQDPKATDTGQQSWFHQTKLNELYRLTRQIEQSEGVNRVLNVTNASLLTLNEEKKRFEPQPFMPAPFSADSADSQLQTLKQNLADQVFYKGLLFSPDYRILLSAVTFSKETMNGKRKHALQKEIEALLKPYVQKHGLEINYAGVPYLRTYMSRRLPRELALFIVASLAVTALALFYFYRTLYSVVFPILLLLICSLWAFGITAVLGFKLTLLMGMLPAIIIILGIPPSIYMLSDYLEEYQRVGNKKEALKGMINRLGLVTLMINANTAFGFLTLYFTDISVLREFGLTAFISTLTAYFLTVVLIPGVFSLLPPPSEKNIRQIDIAFLRNFNDSIKSWVLHRKKIIYLTTFAVMVLATVGIVRLKAISHMKDDLPGEVVTQLEFLEKEAGGAMPFEIQIDFGKDGASKKLRNLNLISRIQDSLDADPRLSRTLSLTDALKMSRQAMYGGEPAGYELPARNEIDLIARYAQGAQAGKTAGDSRKALITSTLTDTNYRKVRITGYVKDVGSDEMKLLIAKTERQIKSISAEEEINIQSFITGTTRIFLKTNEYLIDNLVWSLVATFLIVGLQMWVLFRSAKMMVISLFVNLIPLAVTAGVMGFLNIPLKPSTALIYELAFGIAIDNSIHLLTAYYYYRNKGSDKNSSVTEAIHSTGMGILFTSIVLFCAFGVFLISDFGSTRALGLLTSVTLFTALFSNLILLPAMITPRNHPVT